MRKLFFSLCLFAAAAALSFAQSAIWAGNAARGNDDSFPPAVRSTGKSAGISLALPEGTLVRVKNQKNGITTDVTIVSGQGKPGIFLLLNSAAADSLEIHSGEVIMVEIEEKKAVANPFLDYSADPDAFKKNLNEEFLSTPVEDPDNAAAVDVAGEMDRMGYASGEEPAAEEAPSPEEPADETPLDAVVAVDALSPAGEPEEPAITVPPAGDDRAYEDVIIADGAESYDSVLDFTPEEEPSGEEPVETETFLSDSINLDADVPVEGEAPVEEPILIASAAETGSESVPEPEEVPAPVIDPGRVIYFLTPAELRPPEPVEETPVLPEWEEPADGSEQDGKGDLVVPSEKTPPPEDTVTVIKPAEPADGEDLVFVPQYVESADLNAFMQETLKAGSRYVQVASFSKISSDGLYEIMASLQEAFPYLPLLLLPGRDGKSYRLMAGPVSRDEVGILIYNMKARGFSQAFLSRE